MDTTLKHDIIMPTDEEVARYVEKYSREMCKDHLAKPLKKHLHIYGLDDVLVFNADYDKAKKSDWTIVDYIIRGWALSCTVSATMLEKLNESVANPDVSVVIVSNRWVWAYESTKSQLEQLGIDYDWLILNPNLESSGTFPQTVVDNLRKGNHIVDKVVSKGDTLE